MQQVLIFLTFNPLNSQPEIYKTIMKYIILFLLLTILSTGVHAQTELSSNKNNNDTIRASISVLGNVYHTADYEQLKRKDAIALLRENQEAFKYIKEARVYNTCSFFLGFAGGFMTGYAIFASPDRPDWILASVGLGTALVGLPFDFFSASCRRKAVKVYNDDILGRNTTRIQPELKLQFTGNTFGLALNF